MGLSTHRVWQTVPGEPLTVVIPAHNRVRECLALLRYLQACGFAHPVVVADSTQADRSSALRSATANLARYRYFGAQIGQYEKLARIAQSVTTPYIVVLPDDDIAFPHAIESALKFLRQNQDYVAAHGYSLRFGFERGDFDIYQVEHFIPTISDHEPMQRYFHLMRRYQPHLWAVFRTEVYAKAMEAAMSMKGTVFQEFMFQIVSVISGKVARLPTVYAMRGMVPSQADYSEADPFQWLIKDADCFFQCYAIFRRGLMNFFRTGKAKRSLWTSMRGRDDALITNGMHSALNSSKIPFQQLINLINASYLGRVIDTGTINYAVQYAFGDVAQPVKFPGPWRGWLEPQTGDVIRVSQRPDRRYIWRREVVEAEPRDEISITPGEMTKVEAQLEFYELS
jgi:glycosyltransferase domain-containing protein